MKKITFLIYSLLVLGVGISEAQYTNILNFDNTNGQYPGGDLIISGKKLFGMTSHGAAGWGCVFTIDTNGNNYKDIIPFNGTNTNGLYPNGSLILIGSKLYGMTEYGALNNDGCVFSIDTNGSGYKELLIFNGSTNGSEPFGSLLFLNRRLYGMTCFGGSSNLGQIFSIDTNGTGFKDILDFTGLNGAYPFGSLIYSGPRLFGMTSEGGITHHGNVFSIDTDGTAYTNIFGFSGSNGNYPQGNLIIYHDVFYGMTYSGGLNDSGCIFSIDTNGNNYKDLFDFTKDKGYYPSGSFLLSGKILYGMTTSGGINGYGCVFSIDTDGANYNNHVNFNDFDGANPEGSLILDGGTLYGMTNSGGANFDGVIFKLNTNFSTSVNELTKVTGTINLYPNPNNGQFTIQSTITNSKSLLEVYNTLGEEVYSVPINFYQGSSYQVKITNQPVGLYLYKVVADDGKLIGVGKFIVE